MRADQYREAGAFGHADSGLGFLGYGDVVGVAWFPAALAAAGALTLRAQSPDEESLRRLQDLVTAHLSRFSRRDPLQVD
ncbi:hypothetical protein BOG92_013500 [Streptomyces sp. WAC00263]|nr:hypothetical protein BOG92_013500 [Streptomyces sp. WAC00263]